jgi:hypothetical protein
MFLEDLKLRVVLVKLVCQCTADYVGQHCLTCLFIAVLFLLQNCGRVTFLSFSGGLLAHHSDGLVCSFDSYILNVPHWDPIDKLRFCLIGFFLSLRAFFDFLLFNLKVACLLCLDKCGLIALGLTHVDMLLHDVLGIEHLGCLVRDPLQLMVLHLAGNRRLFPVLNSCLLVQCLLNLNLLWGILDSARCTLTIN